MSVFQARLTRSAFGGKSALILEGFSAVNHQTVDYYINESLFFSVKSDQGRHKRVLKDVDDRFGIDTYITAKIGNLPLPFKSGNLLLDKFYPASLIGSYSEECFFLQQVKQGLLLKQEGANDASFQHESLYVQLYEQLYSIFKKIFGYELMNTYGTLLGFYRNGSMIPGDDDFDCLYISNKTNSKEVAIERTLFAHRLRIKIRHLEGFFVRIGRTGHIKFKRK